MKKWFCIFLLLSPTFLPAQEKDSGQHQFISYLAQGKSVRLYWKDDSSKVLGSIARLKTWLGRKNQTLLFAMNGGMYKPDRSPVGLYIEDGKVVAPLDTAHGNGNFYLLPNGVFYITKDKIAGIVSTKKFLAANVQYATQSGPMLVIDGMIHPAFTKGSANKTIRNGVGILPDGQVIFAMTKEPVNLYDFAAYFKTLGCKNALYLDGFVSRMYLPQKQWMQTDGDFGVMIGIAISSQKSP